MKTIHRLLLVPVLGTLLLVTGCSKKTEVSTTTSLRFPATSNVSISFQEENIPPQCKVFSQRMIFTPPQQTGSQIQQALIADGKKNGADMILIGLAREQDEEVDEYIFFSYGPKTPYLFQKQWQGWKYGFKDWRNEGEIISFGINTLNDKETPFYRGLLIQNIYLTCQLGPSRPSQQ